MAVTGAGIVAALVVVAALAPVLAPYDPQAIVAYSMERPSADHLLGTNGVGQDLLSQLIWGARASMSVAVSASCLAVTIAVLVGVGAGYTGGALDTVSMRVADVFLAVPRLPLILIVAAMAGSSRLVVVMVIGLFSWAPGARMFRSQTLSLRQRGFVSAASGFGGGALYMVRRHLVPALGPVLVAVSVTVAGGAVMAEAGLAFLGLGDSQGTSWGLTLNRALAQPNVLYHYMWPWLLLPSGFAITLAVLGFTFLGVGLEPLMNPRAAGASSSQAFSGRNPKSSASP